MKYIYNIIVIFLCDTFSLVSFLSLLYWRFLLIMGVLYFFAVNFYWMLDMNFILGDGGYFHILLYMFGFCSVTQINYLVSFPSFFFYGVPEHSWWLSGKESAYNAGNARETFAILGLGERNGTHSSILAWEIPWTEELGRLQFMGSKKSWTWLSKHTHIHTVSFSLRLIFQCY